MKSYVLASALFTASAQAASWHPAQLPQAQETQIRSQQTGLPYRVQTARIGKAPPEGYPVLYILDGDTFFAPALILAHSLMVNPTGRSNTPVLLVGIGYPGGRLLDLERRAADFTPKPPAGAKPEDFKAFGGADAFGRFIDTELKPLIAKSAPVNTKRQAVFGHSYAGLFGAYSLFSQPSRFQYYVLSSPSVWWQQKRLFDFAPAAAHAEKLRITAGSLEQPVNAPPRLQERAMLDNARRFADWAEEQGIRTEFAVYAGENHGSVSFRALQDGLRMLQRSWQKEKPRNLPALQK